MSEYKPYKELNIEERLKLQKKFSEQDYLTVEQASIWLECSPYVIRRKLLVGQMVGIKLFGGTVWRVDVQKTKRLFEKLTKKKLKKL